MDLPIKLHSWENGKSNFKSQLYYGDNGQTESFKSMVESVVEWLNEQLPNLNLAVDASLETLRVCLLDGSILCQLLNRLSPGAIEVDISSDPHSATAEKFLSALDKMGLSGFDVSNLEQGSMTRVLECLRGLKSHFNCNAERESAHNYVRKRWNLQEIECLNGTDHSQTETQHSTEVGSDIQRNSRDSKFQTALQNTGLSGNLGPNVKVPELMKLNNLDSAPTQFLFSMIDKVLNEGLERKSADVPNRLADLLRGLVQEIQHRMSNQADKIKSQNNLCKVRGGKYRSRVKALETLAVGAAEESEAVLNHLQRIKIEKAELEDKEICNEQNVIKLMKENDECRAEIGALKQELEVSKKCYEKRHVDMESEAKQMKDKLEEKIKDFEHLLGDSKKKVKELEEKSEHKIQKLRSRELRFHYFVDSQFATIQGLRAELDSAKREMLNTQECYFLEFHHLDTKLKELVDAAENYHMVLAENRKLYNEVQDLKGNIRVYSRIRPFLSGQNHKQTTIEYIGENGELVVANPLKQGKDSRRLFKFNKVFAPTASQEEVFIDTQPLIRSVLDGYNVCIFAYGQTGSGKTYTMTGPDMTSQKDWGVNYRALHDLFQISQNRRSSILYEVDVQMIEIYNEQVRDLLICDGSQKRLGIRSTAQPNGLAVPGASLHPVKSTNDVLELMNIGFMNRAVGATALNERSSRSHSILTVHVRGMDLKSNSVMRGCLHLVDLAGSERVDRSEARGDRLKEAQHINKSLSALGDVIFALAQKNSHVPYRNSKLTQVLQSSLGGQAKTLMFVQLNPDVESYSETISTLKFAERVSGVELGAARSNKEGKNIRELMEQVSSLKDTIVKKDEEIERLRTIKANMNTENRVVNGLRQGFFPPKNPNKLSFDEDYFSENGDRLSGAGSQPSVELKPVNDILSHKNLSNSNGGGKFNDDTDLLGFGDADSEERLSDISDGGISMGTETDGSAGSVVEYTLFPDVAGPAKNLDESISSSKTPKLPPKQQTGPSRLSLNKAFSKAVSSTKKVVPTNSSSIKPKLRPLKRSQ